MKNSNRIEKGEKIHGMAQFRWKVILWGVDRAFEVILSIVLRFLTKYFSRFIGGGDTLLIMIGKYIDL